ncbi:hypothetical protein A6E13_15750 [Aliivibrio fischeri]|uniref:hypothetical protein n=1 Tax=Aliivibrio fischeri TaxID=668 RepID=UPI00080EDBC7|nr:hypothetical protein [Aliivibrio fischeri]OCH32026.1 hypothetical protein A6E13_15750 [Aliivibrio fischeri]
MSYRNKNKFPAIMTEIINKKSQSGQWSDSTIQTAKKDMNVLLEALIAELGVEGCKTALNNQGIEGKEYGYLIKPLALEALNRREKYQCSKK